MPVSNNTELNYPELQATLAGPVLTVSIDRPQVNNALGSVAVRSLQDLLYQVHERRDIRVIVLRSLEGPFCAGGDLNELIQAIAENPTEDQDPARSYAREFGHLLSSVNTAPQAVISVVEGAAYGVGLGLACVSDICIAEQQSQFALPESRLGFPAAQILPFVMQRIGIAQARRLAMTGASVDAATAVRIGIAHEQVAAADIDSCLQRLINQVLACGAQANAINKEVLTAMDAAEMTKLVDRAVDRFAQVAHSDEVAEGLAAFKEKRQPTWWAND